MQIQLFSRLKIHELEKVKWFFKIKIKRNCHIKQLWLSQKSYIEKLTNKFYIQLDDKKIELSLDSVYQLIKNEDLIIKQKIHFYQQMIEFINYAAVIISSNETFASFMLSKFLINLFKNHLHAANRLLQYLSHTKQYIIMFNQSNENTFLVLSNVSYVDDSLTRYSSQEYNFMLCDELIDWKANKQKIVITSIIEIVLLTLSSIEKELIWWTRFFNHITFEILIFNSIIQCDNAQTIRIISNSFSQYIIKLRHVNLHRHWLVQEIKDEKIKIKWISSAEMMIDEFIKLLESQKHREFVRLIDLVANS
jgi:hypothetical protein